MTFIKDVARPSLLNLDGIIFVYAKKSFSTIF